MAKRKGWSDFTIEEKLEALKADVNTALDLAETLKKRLDAAEETIRSLVGQARGHPVAR